MLARAVTAFSEPGATVLLLAWPDTTTPPAGPPEDDTLEDGACAAGLTAASAAVTDLGRHAWTAHLPPRQGGDEHLHGSDATAGTDARQDADLLITVMPARHDAATHTDAVARLAALCLRLGGILAVLTQCDWQQGELTDPTGPMVTAGQNADLLYLQHIVVVHLPAADPRLHPAPRIAATEGGPVIGSPHHRVHGDVLVFAQPHDHTARLGADHIPRP